MSKELTLCRDGLLIRHEINGVPQEIIPGTKCKSKNNWPTILKPVKLLATKKDKGLGDIVERVIGPVGGNLYNDWYMKTFGTKCPKCTKDKNNLNERYPL